MAEVKKTVPPRDSAVPIRVQAIGRKTAPLQDLYFELLTAARRDGDRNDPVLRAAAPPGCNDNPFCSLATA